MYGVRWTEFDNRDRLVTKEKLFSTEARRDRHAERISQADRFYRFVAWLDEEDE